MILAEAVTARLTAASGVTDIVGDEIYWVHRPQGGPLPALVLRQVGGATDDADLEGDIGIQETRVQGSALASTNLEAKTLAKAFADTLTGAFEVDDLLFWDGERERPIDLGADAIGGGFIHEVTQDVILRHSPAG